MSAARASTPRAQLLLTGDELLRGFVQDANSGFIAAQLRDAGIALDEIRIVGDEYVVIADAVRTAHLSDDIDLLVMTGGLGPTHDDRTTEAIASALELQLVVDDDALAVIEARVRAFGRMRTPEEVATFTPGNRKQATLPDGASWVDPLGTAPGYAVMHNDGFVVVVLPGPPSELRHAWAGIRSTDEFAQLLTRVGERRETLLRLWGIPESRAAQVLADSGHEDRDACRVTICARDGELEIAVRGTDPAAIDALTTTFADAFADELFARDDHRSIVQIVGDLLHTRGWTLGLAESCTGGMLGALVTDVAGSSSWFHGSLVTYANSAKVNIAGVDEAVLQREGAVSEAVARQLASGARTALTADVGIGITGIAGPGGGSPDKPVGTVHLAIETAETSVHRQLRVPGDRATIRRRSSTIALHELRLLLERG